MPKMSFLTLRASFFAARRLVRCATDLETLCHKSHGYTSSVTRLTGRKMALAFGLPPEARASANLSHFSRSPKGGTPTPVAPRKARPRAPSDAFRPILPLEEARAGNKQLKIGLPGTGRLEIGRLWKGLIGDWRRLSMPGGLLPRRLCCWNLS